MKSWVQLTPEKAHALYGVPLEMAKADSNEFFGVEHHPLDMDGPWPFLAFLQERDYPAIVTFQIYTVLPEALGFEDFSPLTERGGHLSLDGRELSGLVDILKEYAQRLPVTSADNEKIFRKIEGEEVTTNHLHPEWFPGTERYYYNQVYSPLAQSEEDAITILIFSTGHTGPPQAPSNLFFKIAHFPKQALRDTSFNPLDHSLARIHLDRNGIQELASLLQEHLD